MEENAKYTDLPFAPTRAGMDGLTSTSRTRCSYPEYSVNCECS